MNAAIFINGASFKVSRDTPEDCLRWMEHLIKASKNWNYSFTYQLSTGFIFSNPGDAIVPCGILYREGL